MTETRRNTMVGLFMVVSLTALAYLMVLFGEVPSWLGGAEWDLKIEVNDIAGIESGTPIYLNGIKIGRVSELDFLDKSAPEQGVEIVCKIKDAFSVPTGATALCIGPALGLGRGRVEIYAKGAGMPSIEKGGSIRGSLKNPLEDIIPESLVSSFEGTVRKVGNFAEELTPVAKDLHDVLKLTTVEQVDNQEEAAANLYTAIQRLDHVLKSIQDVIGDPEIRNGLVEAVDNVRNMAADGKAAMADFRDTSANLKIDASRVADRLETAVDNFDRQVTRMTDAAMPILDESAKTSANLRVISGNLVEGRGTLGKLLMDDRLYEVLVLSIDRARDLIDSLRRLAERFEKQGRIGLKVGGFPVDKKVP